MNVKRFYLLPLLLLFLISPIAQSKSASTDSLQTLQNLDSLIELSQYNPESPSHIDWPRIGNPAFVLNGSYLEIRVNGPDNISSWSIDLYREYSEYAITFDSPIRNTSTGVWHINASIPSNALVDLFDLRISVSDGVSDFELIERNAVQVLNSFPDDFTIFHITDTHINAGMPDRDTRLLSALYQATAAGADLVIITGDLVQTGGVNSFLRINELIAQSRVPVLVLPGNHDADAGEVYPSFITVYGDDYYTVNVGPDIFLTMANTHVWASLNSTQLGWIERDMTASTAQTKILSIHYSGPNLLETNETEVSELIRICNETNVDVVITGHVHVDAVEEVEGTIWVSTACMGPDASFGGHGNNGFRVLEFQDGTLTSWNWTINQPWSQPVDSVLLTRQPLKFHDVDVGAYLSITNNLNYSISSQTYDFLVTPLSSSRHYIVSGANVLSTINGTDAFLVRVSFDLDAGESTTIRIYPSDAEAPSLLSISYPVSVLIDEEYVISVNLTNPSSGIFDVYVDATFNGESISPYIMTSSNGLEWSTSLEHDALGEVEFHIIASDYSGLEFTSPLYTLECVTAEPPQDIMVIILVAIGLGGVIFVVVNIIRRK